MRVIVFAVIGLVLGLGGGSGVAVMRAKKAPAVGADSTAKKEVASDAQDHRESARASGTEGEHLAATPVDSSVAPKLDAPKHDSLIAPAPVSAKAATSDTTHSATPAPPGRIAKIFGAMSAKDAARVLQQLDDADVQTVLGGLNDRQAAAILAGFPPERAAAISRAVMRGKKGTS